MQKQSEQALAIRVSIAELESAINFWRNRLPSSRDTMTLCPQAASLAELYAHMIIFHAHEMPLDSFTEKARNAFEQAHQQLTGSGS